MGGAGRDGLERRDRRVHGGARGGARDDSPRTVRPDARRGAALRDRRPLLHGTHRAPRLELRALTMKVRRFDPGDDLIIVKARVLGRHGSRSLSLAFDTAASHTHISSDIIDELGYSPAGGEAITSVRSAIGKETGYTLRVMR